MSRRSTPSLALAAAISGALALAAAASGACGTVILDPAPPGFHNVHCSYETGPKETWTVPAGITEPEFVLAGSDDPVTGTGGRIRVKLPVVAGETLEIELGGNGDGSSVGRNGEDLLVAAGGNGAESNYISPSAEVIDAEEPGQPIGKFAINGSVYIEWYDRREPLESLGPFPSVIFDFLNADSVGFSYTGGAQDWTVPEWAKRVTFELWGGPGGSGEPHGHVLAGYDVAARETFRIWVGGAGEDTTLQLDGGWPAVLALASGGDSERPNYAFPPASPATSLWEGGGIGSQPGNGRAAVHFSPRPRERTYVPPHPQGKPQPCIVPGLRGKRPRAARRALARAHCTLGTITRTPSRRRVRGRIVRQAPPAGSAMPNGAAVAATVGKRR